MTDTKSRRGRPKGSGKDDQPHLARIADILVRDPTLTPTTAMKRLIAAGGKAWPETDATLTRRWQGKWKAEGQRFLIEAQARQRPRPQAAGASRLDFPWPAGLGRQWQELTRPAFTQALRCLETSSAFKAMNELDTVALTVGKAYRVLQLSNINSALTASRIPGLSIMDAIRQAEGTSITQAYKNLGIHNLFGRRS